MLHGSLVLSLLLLTVASSVSPHEGPQASNGHPQQQNHKPSLIKCFECYEPNSTVTGVCSKSGFCEGHWCVKGPDSGGIFRGCMERLPFHEQVPKCVIVKGQDGEDSENCYCSTEFCNSVSRILLSTAMLISIFLVLL
ncbi:hypothetical protein L596_007641 [Steinernema carpocapsae]|uniref:Activin types I and II receptor domain-containing protein n=1 Tax=Steinernema carpocapsae TaxID=34508 RepID=A0A4U5P9Y7_STECR|nr:hypothetical protein L596_007641 [Steinernema carpocapsae]